MNTLLRYSFVTSLVLFASISIPAYAEVPQLAAVPQNLPVSAGLNQRKADLQKWHDELKAKTVAHKSKCTGVTVGTPLDKWCSEEQGRLEDEKTKYIAAVNKFNADVAAAAPKRQQAIPQQSSRGDSSIHRPKKQIVTPQTCEECQVKYNNDITGCDNLGTLQEKLKCTNRAIKEFEDCKERLNCYSKR